MRFEGIYTPIVTPFHDDHTIDEDRFVELIDHLITSGVHGIVLAGTTGEYYAQSAEERVALMALAKDRTRGRLPLIIGTGATRTEDSIAYAEAAKAVGADGIMIASPSYAAPTGLENAVHALAIDRAAGLPVLLYNYPGRTGAQMDVTYLDQVSRSPNVCAIKESSGDIDRLHLIACDYPHLQLACGMDDQALEFFVWGARSWVCAGSNFAPHAHIALYEACCLEGDFNKGRRIMTAMMPLMRVLEQGGKFVQSIKHGLGLRGLRSGPPRRPLQPLDETERQCLAEKVTAMDSAIAEITAEKQP